MDLMKLAKVTVDEFFEMQVAAREELVQDLADGLESLFQDYASFVASSCGTKQGCIPTLPPLTRCNQDSGLSRLWKRARSLLGLSPSFSAGHPKGRKKAYTAEGDAPRPSISRATQRVYFRLNTLHYVMAALHSIDKSLSFFGRTPSRSPRPGSASRRRIAPTRFDLARSSLHSAAAHVSEVAAFRLIFTDSRQAFYEGLYVGGVVGARIRPSLRLLKQNLNLIVAILTDRAQAGAVREVLRAAVDAFLMVLLAGGGERAFWRADSAMLADDLESLRRLFCTSGEGLVAEAVVERESEAANGIVALMALPTERLIEEFAAATCQASGIGGAQKLPMPPTTARWHPSDPNTILRVISYRDDDLASRFLKKTFQMPKRK